MRVAALLTAVALALPFTGQSGHAQEQAKQGETAKPGTAAVLRALDKVNGHTIDAEVAVGDKAAMFGLLVSVRDCRYPADNPTGDAYAFLSVHDPEDGTSHFEGWMIASSPALNALDHSRYDVWVIRCNNS
ncbi:DUF2155 domain-containing protein [Nocardioides marinus]|jgi:hypothetical protein|uniref:DUF2155 domain-containing protein n=1 Tax=unclassified Leisingera TaxID=2614906 RepID=UPI001C973336|nr:DUF2155 domain-containing protein [Nocardioides marinus]